jgi:hypothetical protein
MLPTRVELKGSALAKCVGCCGDLKHFAADAPTGSPYFAFGGGHNSPPALLDNRERAAAGHAFCVSLGPNVHLEHQLLVHHLGD